MAVRGTLDEFTLSDLLGVLAATAKSGCLEIHADGGNGSVWIADGVLLAIETDRSAATPLEEALFELLRLEHGTFTFTPDERLDPNSHHGQDIHQTLTYAVRLLEEWRALQQVIPSMDHMVSLAAHLPGHEVRITPEAWTALIAIAPTHPVGVVAQRCGLGELGICRALRPLIDLGVVTIDPPTILDTHHLAS